MLVVLAGLPGTGKSTIAAGIAAALDATLLSVDEIEAAMLVAGVDGGQPTGLAAYVVADHVARSQLGAGRAVVIDAVNDAAEARAQWEALARETAVPLRWVEVRLDDRDAHRRRLEDRVRALPGDFPEPTWASVEARRAELESWAEPRIVLDAARSVERSVAAAVAALALHD